MKDNNLKYILVILMTLLMGLVLISCGSQTDESTNEEEANEQLSSTVISVKGQGYLDLYDPVIGSLMVPLMVDVDVSALSVGEVKGDYLTGTLVSSSIASVIESGGEVIIKGEVTLTDSSDDSVMNNCPFTLTICDDNPDVVSLTVYDPADLSGDPLIEILSEEIIGLGFTITLVGV